MIRMRRSHNQWVEITHKSGDTMRFRVSSPHSTINVVDLEFEDDNDRFLILRPERAFVEDRKRMEIAKLNNDQIQLRTALRNHLLLVTPDELQQAKEVALKDGDAFRVEVIQELIDNY